MQQGGTRKKLEAGIKTTKKKEEKVVHCNFGIVILSLLFWS